MKIQIIVVGRVRGALQEAVEMYEQRAGRYWKLEVIEVSAGGRSKEPAAVMAAEAERIASRLDPMLDVVAMTREGKPMSSEGLSDYLERLAVRSSPGAASAGPRANCCI